MTTTNCIGPIPEHLRKYTWYASHQAWLRDQGLAHHDPNGKQPFRANLRDADLRDADLSVADLRYANLGSADLRYANLGSADLRYADLRYANLGSADLRYANLRGANLRSADLSVADLSGARDLPEAPSIASIDAAILAAIEAPGCDLNMRDWHTCATTHCRAGWAIHLAGVAGAKLEGRYGPALAGALIYAASGSHPVPNFYATDAEALADLRARAAKA